MANQEAEQRCRCLTDVPTKGVGAWDKTCPLSPTGTGDPAAQWSADPGAGRGRDRRGQ